MSMTIGNPKPYPAGTQLKGIVTPHEHDVLSGRGNFVNYHTGNEHFRSLVKKHKIAYVACPKPEKGRFSKVIVDEIRSMDPPGRFLKQDPATKLWQDIGDKKSLDKTRQALREGAPELLKELTGEDPKPKNLQPQSMAAAQAQIHSSGMVNNMGMGMAGTGMLNAGGMGHTPDQQQYFMQQMAQMQVQQQQRQQAQMGLGIGMDNIAGGFQQLEQVSSSQGVGGFGGDSAVAAGGGGGLNHPGAPQQMNMGAFMQQQQPSGLNSDNDVHNNADSIPSAPAMVPINVINPSGAPLDTDAQAQQDRLLHQQQLLQQQHQKLLEQQKLLRQLQEQQRALQQQQMQAVQLEQQQQGMVSGVNNMASTAGMTDFPGVPGGIGSLNPATMQSMQQQQQQQQSQAVSTGADNGALQNPSSLLNQQEQTAPMKPPAPSGGAGAGAGAGAGRTNRRGSLTFDDLVKGIKSAKAAQKMGMSSNNMSLSVGDIDSNLSSAFEDSLIISVEGSLANSSNSEKKPAAAAAGASGANVASVSENRPTQSNGPGVVPENVTVNQQQQPGSGPMGESSMLRGMAMSDAGMSFSLSDAADLLGGSVTQMSYRGFPESKQDDQDK